MEKKTTRVYELIGIGILGGYALFMLIYAYITKPDMKVAGMGSYTFPISAYAVMTALCVALLVRNLMMAAKAKKMEAALSVKEKEALPEEEKALFTFEKTDKRVWITIAMIIGYMLAWKLVGFSLATLVFIFFEAKILNKESKWLICAIVALGAVVVIYLLFVEVFSIALYDPLMSLLF